MAATSTRQSDIFAITVLIVAAALIVFLVIASIFFFNIFNNNKASTSEATFLFATAIILAAICVGIAIYAIIKIIRHRTIIVPSEPVVVPAPTLTISAPVQTAPAPIYVAAPVAAPVEIPQLPPPLPPRPPLTNNIPRVSSSLSLGVADMPLNQTALTQSALPQAVTQRPSTINQSLSAIGGSESSLEQAITTVSGFD